MTWVPEKKEEKAKLLNQLAIGYRDKCYRHNSPRDCHYLAHFMMTMHNSTRAAAIFRKTCDDYKYGESCRLYAGLAGVHPMESFGYDRKGCDYGQSASCLNGAMLIVSDENVRRLVNEENADLMAVKMLDRGCHLGCDESCYLAGGAYLVGIAGALQKNLSTAYMYDFKACQLGNKLACASLSGALPIEKATTGDPKSNAFLIRRLQLKIIKEREKANK